MNPRRARIAIATIFCLNGLVLASWVPHIPAVQTALGLSEATLGVALLGMAAGALLAIPLAGWAIGRFGSAALVRLSGAAFCAVLLGPLLAPNLPLLIAALMLFGACNGALDVAMNAQAALIERRHGRPIMSSLHGLWSVGGLAGAGIAALALHAGVAPRRHALAAAGLGLLTLALAQRALLTDTDRPPQAPRLARPAGLLLGLGTMAALALMAEGAMGDWSAVWLRHWLGASAALAAGGFAAFQSTMAAGRLAGDRISARLGNAALLRSSAAFAALGLAAALLLGDPIAALAGCACVGLGLSNLIPVLFRSAATMPGVQPGHGLAAVSTAGYCGFLAGPPMIGLAAEMVGLPAALALVVAALAAISVATRWLSAGPRALDPRPSEVKPIRCWSAQFEPFSSGAGARHSIRRRRRAPLR